MENFGNSQSVSGAIASLGRRIIGLESRISALVSYLETSHQISPTITRMPSTNNDNNGIDNNNINFKDIITELEPIHQVPLDEPESDDFFKVNCEPYALLLPIYL